MKRFHLMLFLLKFLILSLNLYADNTTSFKKPNFVDLKNTQAKESQVSSDKLLTLFKEKKDRLSIFEKYLNEIERLDAIGIETRKYRTESWNITIKKLRRELLKAKTNEEIGLIFKKINETYSDLGAKLTLNKNFESKGEIKLGIVFEPEIITEHTSQIRYRVSHVDLEMFSNTEKDKIPQIGDEVININQHIIHWWSMQNHIFCKYPLKYQCEFSFYEHFRKELLPWNRNKNLKMKFYRNGKTWSLNIPFKILTSSNEDTNENLKNEPTKLSETKDFKCKVSQEVYNKDFKLIFDSDTACAFENKKYKNTVFLVISEFNEKSFTDAKKFFESFWKEKAFEQKQIIIDLTKAKSQTGNYHVAWLNLFLLDDYETLFVQFKNIKELQNQKLREHIFKQSIGKNIWYARLKNDLNFNNNLSNDDFLPPVMQNCDFNEKNCKTFFKPYQHGFQGKINIFYNKNCEKSCLIFLSILKDNLKDKVLLIGQHDSGNTTFSYLTLELKTNGEIKITEHQENHLPLEDDTILKQDVAITKTTDEKGNLYSGKPYKPDIFKPTYYNQSLIDWQRELLKEIKPNEKK